MLKTAIKKEINMVAETGQVLFNNHKFVVIYAMADQIPTTLQEIGRLRELNFQMVGEGTGKEVDLDEFDQLYTHIVIWNKKSEDITGACRIGELEKLYQQHGIHSIYSRLEFEFDKPLISRMKTTVELSRLFVNSTGQKNYFGLYLIFCSVSNWMAKSKYYTHLLGSVSISKAIAAEIHGLIIKFCKNNFFDCELSKFITAIQPAEFKIPAKMLDYLHAENPQNFVEFDKFIETHYQKKSLIPILFKKYHIFSAKYLAFGIDDDFSSVTDPLIHVSFIDSERKVLEKFINDELLEDYLVGIGRI